MHDNASTQLGCFGGALGRVLGRALRRPRDAASRDGRNQDGARRGRGAPRVAVPVRYAAREVGRAGGRESGAPDASREHNVIARVFGRGRRW